MSFYFREVGPKESVQQVFMEADFLNASVYVSSEERRAVISTHPMEDTFECVFASMPEA